MPAMIEQNRRSQSRKQICGLGDLLGRHMDLDMPAEFVNELRQGLHHVDSGSGACTRLKRMARTPRRSSHFSSAAVMAGIDARYGAQPGPAAGPRRACSYYPP